MTEEKRLKEELLAALRHIGIAQPEATISEFDFLTISEETENLSKAMAQKVKDRIQQYAHLLEDLIQPDNDLSSLNEVSFFDEEDQKKIIKSYRHLMGLVRTYTEADLRGGDIFAKFIISAITEWQREKEWLLTIAQRLQEGWKGEEKFQVEKGYFG